MEKITRKEFIGASGKGLPSLVLLPKIGLIENEEEKLRKEISFLMNETNTRIDYSYTTERGGLGVSHIDSERILNYNLPKEKLLEIHSRLARDYNLKIKIRGSSTMFVAENRDFS